MGILLILIKLLDFYGMIILVSVVGTWIDPFRKIGIFNMTRKITDPVLNKFRIIIPMGNGGIDVSPVIVLWIIGALRSLIIKFVF